MQRLFRLLLPPATPLSKLSSVTITVLANRYSTLVHSMSPSRLCLLGVGCQLLFFLAHDIFVRRSCWIFCKSPKARIERNRPSSTPCSPSIAPPGSHLSTEALTH